MRASAGGRSSVLFVAGRVNAVVRIRRLLQQLGTSVAVRYAALGTLLLLALWAGSAAVRKAARTKLFRCVTRKPPRSSRC